MNFQSGQRVRINEGELYGVVAIFDRMDGEYVILRNVPFWGTYRTRSIIDPNANNGD